MSAEWVVGVDFGTAFSKAAATRRSGSGRVIIPLRLGGSVGYRQPLIVPSAVFLHRERLYFGPAAKRALAQCEDDTREPLQSFKMILSANDFENTVDMLPPRGVDPDGAFTMRQLIVLYLAYLLELISQSAPSEMGQLLGPGRATQFRYSRPAWNLNRPTVAGQTLAGIFRAAAAVREELGPELLSEQGLPFARASLERANLWRSDDPIFEGGVYEAGAVAACHYLDGSAPEHLLIADIGAGTTDFAGFVRDPHSGEIKIVPVTRATIDVAGDAFDRALTNLILAKAKTMLRSRTEQYLFWRRLRGEVRELKENMLETGRIEVRDPKVKVKASEFFAYADTRSAAHQISRAFAFSMKEMVRYARKDGARCVGVVLSGGGGNLRAAHQMVKVAQQSSNIKIMLMPSVPRWALHVGTDVEFMHVFSQMSVAFGTALIGLGEMRGEKALGYAVA